jgi:hypothetical protein
MHEGGGKSQSPEVADGGALSSGGKNEKAPWRTKGPFLIGAGDGLLSRVLSDGVPSAL